jgi:hypothetical protein
MMVGKVDVNQFIVQCRADGDGLPDETTPDKQALPLHTDAAASTHPAQRIPRCILQRWQPLWIGSRTHLVAACRDRQPQRIMGPLQVVDRPEPVQGCLTGHEVGQQPLAEDIPMVRWSRSTLPRVWG